MPSNPWHHLVQWLIPLTGITLIIDLFDPKRRELLKVVVKASFLTVMVQWNVQLWLNWKGNTRCCSFYLCGKNFNIINLSCCWKLCAQQESVFPQVVFKFSPYCILKILLQAALPLLPRVSQGFLGNMGGGKLRLIYSWVSTLIFWVVIGFKLSLLGGMLFCLA